MTEGRGVRGIRWRKRGSRSNTQIFTRAHAHPNIHTHTQRYTQLPLVLQYNTMQYTTPHHNKQTPNILLQYHTIQYIHTHAHTHKIYICTYIHPMDTHSEASQAQPRMPKHEVLEVNIVWEINFANNIEFPFPSTEFIC